MDSANIVQLLGHLKAQHVMVRGKWVQCSCPLAPWLHDSGKDSSPSFAVRVEPLKASFFNCSVCKHGSLSELIAELQHLKAQTLGYDLLGAWQLIALEDAQKLNLEIKEWGEKTVAEPDTPIPDWWLDTFKKAWQVPYAREYLEKRMVTHEVCERLDIRWDRSRRTVCFPVKNSGGDLVSMRGRHINPDHGQPTYHVYPFMGKQNGQAWLGEHYVDWSASVLIAESVFDLTSCMRVYGNVISPMSVGINQLRMKRIAKACEVVTLFDHGVGGDKARTIVSKYMGTAMVTHLLPTLPAKDAGEMEEEPLRELLRPALKLT